MIETKVVVASVTSLIGAVFTLLALFGLSVPSGTRDAVIAVIVAAWPLITAAFAFLAPHTHRPDLPPNPASSTTSNPASGLPKGS